MDTPVYLVIEESWFIEDHEKLIHWVGLDEQAAIAEAERLRDSALADWNLSDQREIRVARFLPGQAEDDATTVAFYDIPRPPHVRGPYELDTIDTPFLHFIGKGAANTGKTMTWGMGKPEE